MVHDGIHQDRYYLLHVANITPGHRNPMGSSVLRTPSDGGTPQIVRESQGGRDGERWSGKKTNEARQHGNIPAGR